LKQGCVFLIANSCVLQITNSSALLLSGNSLLAFKNKHNLELSQIISDMVSMGDVITTQDIIQKFDEV